MRIPVLPASHASVCRALKFVLTIVAFHAANDIFVASGCQLCYRHVGSTNTPISFRLTNTLEPLVKELDHNIASVQRRDGLILKNVESAGKISSVFLPRRRRKSQPLYMMFDDDDKHGELSSASNVENITIVESLKNQTEFDSAKFFDELERSGYGNSTNDKELEKSTMSVVMIGAIGFYKKVISPLLPPACRFVPTCSTYGVQAIQEYGPTKGCILIAWRILRCTPIGGKGYDPPKWPPVFYTYSSY